MAEKRGCASVYWLEGNQGEGGAAGTEGMLACVGEGKVQTGEIEHARRWMMC